MVSSFLDNLNKEEVFYKMKKYFIGIIWKDETTPLLHLKDYTTYKDEYIDVVKKTQRYIKEGDIFQAVISNRIEADFSGSLLNAYRILRTINPSPYMFYLSSKQI